MKPKTSIIVARAKDQGIGCSEGLPWRISEELKYFKNKTMGKPIIMGRKTYESILDEFGSPLPGRENIVVSRSGFSHPKAITCTSLQEAIETAQKIASKNNKEELFVIGGSELFKQSLPLADKVYLTEIGMECTARKANAWLENKDIPDYLETISSEEKLLEEKLTKTQVKCEFKVMEKPASAYH